MRFKACTLCSFILLTASSIFAQISIEQSFEQLQRGTTLPEGLQSTRTIVILKSELPTALDSGKGLEILTSKFHEKLVDMHIDAVAYFRWQDLVAGFDATTSYLEAISNREANQLIVLQAENMNYQLFVVPTEVDLPLFAPDRPAWHTSGTSLEVVMENLATAVRRSDLEIANFLIAETPEIFIDTEIFQKNRFESFQPDLKLDKLAVPLFTGTDPENIGNQDDQQLKDIFNTLYPFYFEVVSAQMTEDLMKKAGFHYVLRYLHAEEPTLLTLLDYEDSAGEESQAGYKFYVKHLISGDIYLGNSWDSRPSWQSALNLHLNNMRRSLKVE